MIRTREQHKREELVLAWHEWSDEEGWHAPGIESVTVTRSASYDPPEWPWPVTS